MISCLYSANCNSQVFHFNKETVKGPPPALCHVIWPLPKNAETPEMAWRLQESLQSSKALAILELKDCAIENLERELDAVQSKLAEIKNDMRQNEEDLQLQAEQAEQAAFDRRRGCQDSAMKTRLAEERWEAAREQAEELRKDRDAVEVVAERLMQLRVRLEAETANLHAESQAHLAEKEEIRQSGQRLWDILRSAMTEHKAQLSLMEVKTAQSVHNNEAEEKWMLERQCNELKEELRWLKDQHREVDGQRQSLEKRALHDHAKAESMVRDEQRETLRMRKEMEEALKKGQCRRRNEQALLEAEQELDTLRSELQLAEDHQATGPVGLGSCTSLVGRLGALAELEASMKARRQVFQKSLENLEARRVAEPEALLLHKESVANTLAMQQSGQEQLSELNQELQLKASTKSEEVEQAERQKALRQELLELGTDGALVKEPLPLPRLRPLLLRQLSQLSSSGWSAEDQDLQELLDNLMTLLRELQQQFLEAQRSSEEWKLQVLAPGGDITPLVPARKVEVKWGEDLLGKSMIDESATTDMAKLEAKEAVLKSELAQQKKHFESMKEKHLVETAAFKVEAARAGLRGRQKFFKEQGHWRDVLTESVWTMVQRVAAGALAASEPAKVLRAAELLRIMGFQLCALELGWMLQQRQVYGDLLQCAAMFSKQLRAPAGSAWRQRFVQLAEAEQLSMDALRLKSEVQTMKAELHEEKSKEQSLQRKSADPSLAASTVDRDVLMSTLSTMGEVMQMCFRLVSAESEGAKAQSDYSTQILREVQDVGHCCQQLQEQLAHQKEMIKSLAVRDTLQRDAMKELELWPRKLEGLLGLQHDLQLEYKSAAEELLKLRDSRSELAQALKAEQAGGWASGLVSLESCRIFYMF